VRREDWIAAQPKDHYTLQIMSSSREDALLDLLERQPLSGDVAYFRANVNGQTRYSAIYGVFASPADAEAARGQLPADLRKANPWIRQFGAIQSLIQQPSQN
jgi:septal ring-binding cell division protein DamX